MWEDARLAIPDAEQAEQDDEKQISRLAKKLGLAQAALQAAEAAKQLQPQIDAAVQANSQTQFARQ